MIPIKTSGILFSSVRFLMADLSDFFDSQNSLENLSGNKLVWSSGYNRVSLSGSWPPDASITLSLHCTPPPPPLKPCLPDDFCRPSVSEYNLWVIVDSFRGVG